MEHIYRDDSVVFLPGRDPLRAKASYRVTHPIQLQLRESVDWLNVNGLYPMELSEELLQKIRSGCARVVNINHPAAQRLIERPWDIPSGKLRVHVLAMGDVGATLLLGLVLLGGDVISSIGICDVREHVLRRYEYEMNQISWPFEYDALPAVQTVPQEELFECDVFVFCASRAVPPVGVAVEDVRMAQLQGNASILKAYAKQAREAGFHGLFAVVSDPVDLLSQYAFLESNRNEAGVLDWRGLLPEQIRGYGLGVMNARAAYYAKRASRFASFLTQGRAYGPHGKGLIIANSVEAYDDALSLELTRLATEANLRMREAGFKPYIAPALSSGAMSILLTVRREWHYSAIFLDGVYFGCKNRQSSMGIEAETLSLPSALHERIRQEHAMLWEQGSQWRGMN
ncbi:MAG: lactate dehydrogenase [Bacillota bacterium]